MPLAARTKKRTSKPPNSNDHVYERFFRTEELFFGREPAPIVCEIAKLLPPTRALKVLEIGSGEGRNAVFLAKAGYDVTAYDISKIGVEKMRSWAQNHGLRINAFTADMKTYRVREWFDIIFSTWTFQFLPEALRGEVIQNCKKYTRPGGLNAFSVFVRKPFIKVPHHERNARLWKSGELLSHYWNWKVEFCSEEIFDCQCGGKKHQHAANSVIARKKTDK
jgi:tellurite methyltransferase